MLALQLFYTKLSLKGNVFEVHAKDVAGPR